MRCAVLYCNTSDQNEKYEDEIFFPFPQDSNMCKVWKYACGRGENFQTDKARICERHFDKTDYEKHVVRFDYTDKGVRKYRQVQLKSYAIPTLNLPKLSENVRHCILFPKRGESATNSYIRSTGEVGETPIRTYERIKKKCAISNCNQKSRIMYNFPHYQHQKDLFIRWSSLCQNEEIKHMQPEDVNLAYGICDGHFEKEIVIIPELLPTVDLPGPRAEKRDEPCEPRQLCRLCFSPGNVDLFTFKYYKMLLKDILKNFVPIEIKRSDPSTLICEKCKSEVIHFHNFLLKSLRVNEYFDAINKEANNKEGSKVSSIELIRIDDDVLEDTAAAEENQETNEIIVQEQEAEEDNNEDIHQDDVILIEDDPEQERQGVPPSLLWKCLTSDPKMPAKSVVEDVANQDGEEDLTLPYYVPDYVLKYFHTYVKTGEKAEKENVKKKVSKMPKDKPPKAADGISGKRKRKRDNQKDDTIICIHCDKVIDSLDEFNEHCKSENHDPIFRCPDCSRIFKTQSELDIHADNHKRSNSGMCDRCGKQFSKRDALQNHMNNVHNRHNLKHECNVCNKKFATKYRLKLHTRVHTNDRPYCCEHCGAVFAVLANLRNHQTIHSDYKPHVCLICNKGFRRRNKLVMHLTKHTDERKFACDKCGIAYKRQLNLTRHNRKHHPDPNETVDEKPRKCALCDFMCNYAVQLRVHMLKEHKPYTCTICGANFKSYQPYYNHKFKHFPKNKKYVCKYCNKRFINGTLLNVHMVVHTGRKDFECEFCQKKFSQRPHLQSHLLVHTGEKPYKCRFCTKSFAHLSTLVVHERIHTGETPYVCQFCKKGFGHLTNYKKHVFSQHGVIMPKQRDYSSVMKVEEDEIDEDKEAADMILSPIIEFVDGEVADENSLDADKVVLQEMSI